MESLNIKRLSQVALWYLRMYYPKVTALLVGLTLGYLLICLAYLWPVLRGGGAFTASDLTRWEYICAISCVVIFVISGSWLFIDMDTKERRITVRMLPASDLEKFAVRLLTVTVGVLVWCMLAFFLADLLRVAVSLTAGVGYTRLAMPDYLEILCLNHDGNLLAGGKTLHYPFHVCVACVMWLIWAHSLYALGSTLLRRYRFAVTTAVHVLLLVVFGAVMSCVTDDFKSMLLDSRYMVQVYVFAAAAAALAVLNYRLCYLLFRRGQVINNKWICV